MTNDNSHSPRWLICDLDCGSCEAANECPFLLRHKEALAKADLKEKRKKKQKRIKGKSAAAAVNAREENARGSVPSALPSEDDEDIDPTDPTRCENCLQAFNCKLGKVKDCMVIQAKSENIDWFMPLPKSSCRPYARTRNCPSSVSSHNQRVRKKLVKKGQIFLQKLDRRRKRQYICIKDPPPTDPLPSRPTPNPSRQGGERLAQCRQPEGEVSPDGEI